MDLRQLEEATEFALQLYKEEMVLHGSVPLDDNEPIHIQTSSKLLRAAIASGKDAVESEFFFELVLRLLAALDSGARFRAKFEVAMAEPRGR